MSTTFGLPKKDYTSTHISCCRLTNSLSPTSVQYAQNFNPKISPVASQFESWRQETHLKSIRALLQRFSDSTYRFFYLFSSYDYFSSTYSRFLSRKILLNRYFSTSLSICFARCDLSLLSRYTFLPHFESGKQPSIFLASSYLKNSWTEAQE